MSTIPDALERTARYAVLLILLPLTSCAGAAYLAELEPPAQYDHPYDGPVDERVMPVSEVRTVCLSMGAEAFGVACAWVSDDGDRTCNIVLPSNEVAPVALYRRHEIAHCNGWPWNHPRDASPSSQQLDQSQDALQDNGTNESVDDRANGSTADYTANARQKPPAADESENLDR